LTGPDGHRSRSCRQDAGRPGRSTGWDRRAGRPIPDRGPPCAGQAPGVSPWARRRSDRRRHEARPELAL